MKKTTKRMFGLEYYYKLEYRKQGKGTNNEAKRAAENNMLLMGIF